MLINMGIINLVCFPKAFTLLCCKLDHFISVLNHLKRYYIIEIDLIHSKSSKYDSNHEIYQAYLLILLFFIDSIVIYIFEDLLVNTKDDFPMIFFFENNHSQD